METISIHEVARLIAMTRLKFGSDVIVADALDFLVRELQTARTKSSQGND